MKKNLLLCTTLLSCSPLVIASSLDDIKISGFIGVTAAKSDAEQKYFDLIGDKITYDETNIGINLSKHVTNKLSIQAQLFGHDINDGVIFDWFFASYDLTPTAKIKLGKLKYGGSYYSEVVDVGFAYNWVRLPTEIYGHNEADAILSIESFKGAAMQNTFYLDEDEELEFGVELFTGVSEAVESDEAALEDILGAKFSLGNDTYYFSTTYTAYKIEEEDDYDEETSAESGREELKLGDRDATLWATVAKAEWENLYLTAEYVIAEVDDVSELDTTAWYASAGYSMGKLTPHITYASFDQDSGRAQDSFSLGVKYNFDSSIIVKAQYDKVHPKSTKDTGEVFFEDSPKDDNVNIFSISLNYIF